MILNHFNISLPQSKTRSLAGRESRELFSHAHLEKSTPSTKYSAPTVDRASVFSVVAAENVDERWEVCSLVDVKKVATEDRLRLVKLSRTALLGLAASAAGGTGVIEELP